MKFGISFIKDKLCIINRFYIKDKLSIEDKLYNERPLIFIVIYVIIGNLTYIFSYNNFKGAVLFTASLIFMSLIIYDKRYSLLVLGFFLLGFITNFIYYNSRIPIEGQYTITVDKISKKTVQGNLAGKKVYINYCDDLNVGEKILIEGKFKRSIDFNNGVVGDIFVKNLKGRKRGLSYKIKNLSSNYYKKISKYVGEENGALTTALVFGNKDNLKESQNEYFKELGIIHLICISGFHVAFVFLIINKFFKTKIALLFVFIYTIVTGASPSTVRAFLMILVLKSSKIVYKNYDPISSLCLSAVILLLFKPFVMKNMGFILSYLATLGIILFYKKFLRAFYKLPNKANESLSVSISAQFFVLPYMILKVKSISLNSIIATFFITPLVTVILASGILFYIISFNDFLMKSLAKIMNLVFYCLNMIIKFLNYIALPMVYTDKIMFITYISMIICFYMYYKGFKIGKRVAYCIFLCFLIFNISFSTKIKFYNEKWNDVIVLERGINKIALVNSDNRYTINKVKEDNRLYDVISVKKKKYLKVNDKIFIVMNNDNGKQAYIMVGKEKYDIMKLKKSGNEFVEIFNNKVVNIY